MALLLAAALASLAVNEATKYMQGESLQGES